MNTLGYKDGKNDKSNEPKNVKPSFLPANQKGFEKGQQDLKQSYLDKGYLAAFTMLKYKKATLENSKYITWYQEGFESNKEVLKIEKIAYNMGLKGEKLSFPHEYIDSKVIFAHHYGMGPR